MPKKTSEYIFRGSVLLVESKNHRDKAHDEGRNWTMMPGKCSAERSMPFWGISSPQSRRRAPVGKPGDSFTGSLISRSVVKGLTKDWLTVTVQCFIHHFAGTQHQDSRKHEHGINRR